MASAEQDPKAKAKSQKEDKDENASTDEEWERRLASGDLPEDFLKVTEPGSNRAAGMATNKGFEPEVGELIDIPKDTTSTNENAAKASETSRGRVPSPSELGPKPTDKGSSESHRFMSTEEQDHAMALALQEQLNMEDAEAASAHQHQQPGTVYATGMMRTIAAPANMVGRLTITVVEARLAKNYGYVKMDPYCRVRVGHSVYETPTCAKGSKEPKWNRTFTCYLLHGVRNIDVEIYDECTFTQDSLIAYGSFPIPEPVMVQNEVSDEWYPMSGNEGAGKEGMIHLIISLQPITPGQPMQVPQQSRIAQNVSAGHRPMAYQTAPLPQQQQQQEEQQDPQPRPQQIQQLTEEELEEFVKMFPNLDKEIILSVHQACRGNKEEMVNNLLQLGQQ